MSTDKFIVGAFYMVKIALDPDCENEWENELMPARFAGYDNDGAETWNYLESVPNPWPVVFAEPIKAKEDK